MKTLKLRNIIRNWIIGDDISDLQATILAQSEQIDTLGGECARLEEMIEGRPDVDDRMIKDVVEGMDLLEYIDVGDIEADDLNWRRIDITDVCDVSKLAIGDLDWDGFNVLNVIDDEAKTEIAQLVVNAMSEALAHHNVADC